MKIVKEDNKDLTVLIKVTVEEADYTAEVEKTLKEYRRKANIPGFRPGMVPMGIINKMYRRGVVAEQSYRKATDACYDYVKKNNIDYVGDILPAEQQAELDFENSTVYEFDYELGLAPKVELTLGATDKLTYYKIKVAKDMKDNYRTNFLRRFGSLKDVDKVTKEEAVTGSMENADGVKVSDAYVGLISMTEEERAPFIGKKVGDTVSVDVTKLYKTEAQRAKVLGVKEKELDSINPAFTLTIAKIRQFAEPELNAEFFKTAFPAGNVTDEAGLDTYLDAQIEEELDRESKYLFTAQLRNYMLEKAALKLPEAFLKRWLSVMNEGKFSDEEIAKEMPGFVRMMSWNIIRKHYETELKLTVTDDEMLSEAKALAQMQFAQYGMGTVPEDTLTSYAKSILGNKDEHAKIYDKLTEEKVIEAVKPSVKITTKSVTSDEFAKVAQAVQF